ncbi:FxSxx-COOH system tetratricopeptide repeat protein [Sphaerisporangium aureirubrum]|uniref:FxSxx-COOH system tetratricopeptide repeat protein n=1 Tax=Sphaerisporangium aureirubrum TaxID=1544736 RepID=A0ABW1NHA9_9ACTN
MNEPAGVTADDPRGILDLVDEPHRSALLAWMDYTRTGLRPVKWTGTGNTKASLLAVYATRLNAPAAKLIVKLHPAGSGIPPEPGRHADALAHSPVAFRAARLVEQPFDPIPVDGDGYILFLEIAGGRFNGLEPLARPLEQGPAVFGDVAAICADVMAIALGEWNPRGPKLAPYTVPGFLTSILGDRVKTHGKVREWLRDPANHARALPGGAPVVPDPLALLDDPALTAGVSLMALTGNAHGDLHPGNVIVSADPAARPPVRRFIDLSRFRTDAPLSHDPLHFVMSVIAPCLPGLPEAQRTALGEFLISPGHSPQSLVLNGLGEIVTRISLATSAWAGSVNFADEWEDMYLPSVVSCALLYAARAFFPREDRLWFTWVAARAAAEFLKAKGLGDRVPSPAATLARRDTPPVPAPVAPAPASPSAVTRSAPPAGRPEPWVRMSNMPERVPYFVARKNTLAGLRGLMRAGRTSVVAVHGMPGTGKTQLALEYAHRYAGEYTHLWWISAGRPELLGEQFGGLARELGLEIPGDVRSMRGALFDEMRARGHWLLIFDGAPDAAAIQAYVPASDAADVLITSRSPEWSSLATPLPLGPLTPEESRDLLAELLDGALAAQAAPIAETLGHLPLAVAQAALFLQDAPLDPAGYAGELSSRTAAALDTEPVPGYGQTLSAAWSLGLDSLAEARPEAVDLLRACAFLADAPVPLDLLAAGADGLPWTLPAVAADRIRLTAVAKAAARSGLLRIEGTALRVHGLLQAFLRDTTPTPAPDLRPVLARAHPGDPRDPGSWPGYGSLLPHVLALDLPGSPDPACHRLYLDALHYLAVRGDTRTVRDLTTAARARWLIGAGPDAGPVLEAMSLLSRAHYDLGEFRRARELDQEVYDRRARLLGPDDPATLAAGHNLAGDLSALAGGGDVPAEVAERASALLDTVVAARRRVLGGRHPETLRSAHNLASELRTQGRPGPARELCEEALAGLTEELGPDHPDTLRSAHLLALLLTPDEPARAHRLNEDTLHRRTRVLGPDHLDTLRSAHSHARDLWTSGFTALARTYAQDTRLRLCATFGEDHPEALRAADLLARVLRTLGDLDGAHHLAEDTYHRRARLLGEAHVETLRSADLYATALRTAGDTVRATELTRRTGQALRRLTAATARA